jgi:glycosyltransferase involved in cell wall biosynthesis
LCLRYLTIIIPIKNPPNLDLFIAQNKLLLQSEAHKIIVDSGGGSKFQNARDLGFLPLLYVSRNLSLWEARKFGYEHTVTLFILNLDCDVVLPFEYVQEAILNLQNDKADAIAIQFDPVKTGHLEFGTSIWKTPLLKKLYDYPPKPVEKLIKVGKQEWVTAFQCGFCECTYMWSKLIASGGRLETLPYRAKHLK